MINEFAVAILIQRGETTYLGGILENHYADIEDNDFAEAFGEGYFYEELPTPGVYVARLELCMDNVPVGGGYVEIITGIVIAKAKCIDDAVHDAMEEVEHG